MRMNPSLIKVITQLHLEQPGDYPSHIVLIRIINSINYLILIGHKR